MPAKKSSSKKESPWDAVLTRKAGEKRFWLVKTEPSTFSFDDLLKAPEKTINWDGIRNFTARNFLREGLKKGDQAFFYHTLAGEQSIVGIAEVVKEGYPEPDPTWTMVDLRAVAKLDPPVTLAEIKSTKSLADMVLVRISRLSVQPVSEKEWKTILGMTMVREI